MAFLNASIRKPGRPGPWHWVAVGDHGGVSMSRTLGTEPNYCTIEIVDQGGSEPVDTSLAAGEVVDLTLSDGDRQVVFPNMTIHEIGHVDDPQRGNTYRLTLKDKRHALHRGHVTGEYNKPASGVVYTQAGLLETEPRAPSFRRTLRELAHILFEAMGLGEDDYDTSQLTYQTGDAAADAVDPFDPNRTLSVGDDLQIYPAVRWEFANPAAELERLLAEYNFGVTLWEPFDADGLLGRMVVVRMNQLHPLQAAGFTPEEPFGFDYREDRRTLSDRTTNVAVIGGRIEREITVPLIPVGLDVDGAVKPLADLSYASNVGGDKPYGDFEKVIGVNPIVWRDGKNIQLPEWPTREDDTPYDPETGETLTVLNSRPSDMLERVRQKASASVWKWYQLPANYRWVLPILPETARTQETELAVFRRGPTLRVRRYGRHEDTADNPGVSVWKNPPETHFESIDDGYSIDFAQGIVKFDQRTVLMNSGTTSEVRPAEVKLTFSYASKQPVNSIEEPIDPDTVPATTELLAQVSPADYYTFPNAAEIGADWDLIRRPELVPYEVNGQIVNQDDLDTFAQQLIDDAVDGLSPTLIAPEGNVPYIVLNRVPDGLIRQISWKVSARGADTTLVANRENPNLSLSKYTYRERLFQKEVAQRGRGLNLALPFMRPGSSIMVGDHLGGGGPGNGPGKGIVTSDPRYVMSQPNTIMAESRESVRIPAHSFVWMAPLTRLGSEGERLDAGLVQIYNPADYEEEVALNPYRIGVTVEDIPPNGTGLVAHSGLVMVRVNHDVGDEMLVRPGTSGANGFIGHKDDGIFPTIVTWPLYSSAPAGHLALIKLEPFKQVAQAGVLAVVTSCSYNSVSHSLMVTASRLKSIPYGYNPEPETADNFVAWAGVDPLIVADSLVILFQITPIEADMNITHFALPVLSGDRAQLTPPAMECLTEFVEPCSGDVQVDLCG